MYTVNLVNFQYWFQCIAVEGKEKRGVRSTGNIFATLKTRVGKRKF